MRPRRNPDSAVPLTFLTFLPPLTSGGLRPWPPHLYTPSTADRPHGPLGKPPDLHSSHTLVTFSLSRPRPLQENSPQAFARTVSFRLAIFFNRQKLHRISAVSTTRVRRGGGSKRVREKSQCPTSAPVGRGGGRETFSYTFDVQKKRKDFGEGATLFLQKAICAMSVCLE